MAARRAAPPPGPVPVIAVERELDALYQVPLEGFVAARNALAARLKAAGRPGDASAVKALGKPPATAWALNQVHWTERPLLDALAAAGQRLLDAQRAGLAGRAADMAGAARARQAAVDAVVDGAVQVLMASGAAGGLDARRRLTASADALGVRGAAMFTQEPRPGRLTGDLDPPGFAVLAALAGATGEAAEAPAGAAPPVAAAAAGGANAAPGASGPQPGRRAAIDAATRAVAAAETALEGAAAAEFAARESLAAAYARRLDASRAVEAATAALAEAQRRVEATRGGLATADLALARARAEADPLERAARDAAAARERAAAALADARTRLDGLWSNIP
jgi:hypothetical protein